MYISYSLRERAWIEWGRWWLPRCLECVFACKSFRPTVWIQDGGMQSFPCITLHGKARFRLEYNTICDYAFPASSVASKHYSFDYTNLRSVQCIWLRCSLGNLHSSAWWSHHVYRGLRGLWVPQAEVECERRWWIYCGYPRWRDSGITFHGAVSHWFPCAFQPAPILPRRMWLGLHLVDWLPMKGVLLWQAGQGFGQRKRIRTAWVFKRIPAPFGDGRCLRQWILEGRGHE